MSFTHSFTGMKEAKRYANSMKESVSGSDTEVITTLYINNKL